MADKIDDGGPAYPHTNPDYDGNWDKEPQRGGMSLRDWFAGQVISNMDFRGETPERAADWSYSVADAMLSARNGEK